MSRECLTTTTPTSQRSADSRWATRRGGPCLPTSMARPRAGWARALRWDRIASRVPARPAAMLSPRRPPPAARRPHLRALRARPASRRHPDPAPCRHSRGDPTRRVARRRVGGAAGGGVRVTLRVLPVRAVGGEVHALRGDHHAAKQDPFQLLRRLDQVLPAARAGAAPLRSPTQRVRIA